jgi:ABC-2 type transport system ATP-binding protein
VEADGSLSVRGPDEVAIAKRAANLGVTLFELWPQSETLEEVFIELTEESLEYHSTAAESTRGKKAAP